MSELLTDYPIYEPPHRQGQNFPRKTRNQDADEAFRLGREFAVRGEENFAYFLTQRETRLAALGAFLRESGVNMGVDDAGLQAVSAWCPGKYGALVANHRDAATRQAFFEFSPWTGRLRGLNVIFDLAIFLGECAIARRSKLRWKNVAGRYQIVGFKGLGNSLDPPRYMYNLCANDEAHLRSSDFNRSIHVNALVGIVRDYSSR